MKKVMISLKVLYDTYGSQLKHGKIIKEVDGKYEYYDLQTDKGTVCMDGEECEVINNNELGYTLLNIYEEDGMDFILTSEEFETAVFETVN